MPSRPLIHWGRARGLLAATVMLVACMSARPVHAWTQPDTIVRQAGVPRHAGIATLVPELSVGTVDGPIEYAFVRVTDIASGPDGSFFVLDVPFGATPFLRQYDASGRYVRTIGRLGRGPGEYTGPAGITVLSDGRILLLDGLGARINLYSPRGEFIDTWQMRDYRSDFVTGTGGALMRRGPDDIVTIEARVRRAERPMTPDRFARVVVIRLRSDGTMIDTIPEPELSQPPGASVARVNRRPDGTIGSFAVSTVPYAPQAMWAWSPLGYAVTGIASRYAFELRVPPVSSAVWNEGDPVISIRRAYTPITVAREERSARADRLRAALERGTGTVEGPIPPVPDRKPPYTSIAVGDDGRFWVHISTPSEKYAPPPPEARRTAGMSGASGGAPATRPAGTPLPVVPWREPTVYDVFEPDGTYLGQVGVPYDTRLVRMKGDIVWAVVVNEDDVPIVKRYRLAWGREDAENGHDHFNR